MYQHSSIHFEEQILYMGGLLPSLHLLQHPFCMQTHTDVDAGRTESNRPGNQVVSRTSPALWCRFPSRAWLALQSELSVDTTVKLAATSLDRRPL